MTSKKAGDAWNEKLHRDRKAYEHFSFVTSGTMLSPGLDTQRDEDENIRSGGDDRWSGGEASQNPQPSTSTVVPAHSQFPPHPRSVILSEVGHGTTRLAFGAYQDTGTEENWVHPSVLRCLGVKKDETQSLTGYIDTKVCRIQGITGDHHQTHHRVSLEWEGNCEAARGEQQFFLLPAACNAEVVFGRLWVNKYGPDRLADSCPQGLLGVQAPLKDSEREESDGKAKANAHVSKALDEKARQDKRTKPRGKSEGSASGRSRGAKSSQDKNTRRGPGK